MSKMKLTAEDIASVEGLSSRAAAAVLGVGKSTINEARAFFAKVESVPGESETHNTDGSANYVRFSAVPWGHDDYREFIKSKGQNPDEVTFSWGWTSNPGGGFWNKLNNVRPINLSAPAGGPAWPVVQAAAPVNILIGPVESIPHDKRYKLSIKGGDTQIGYRRLPDGEYESFHDEAAMDLFIQVCAAYQPDTIDILGDFLDLASQGKYVQEAGFAQTTQMSIDAGYRFLAALRAACPDATINLIEGNHDKRMQNFIELNAVSAFGLKKADLPEQWPVMSLPYLMRMDELSINYVDAYPAATVWTNENTRNIHGTRANSKGSTMSQYVHELPHINTWAGHTHRTEIVYRSVQGGFGQLIESYGANPGCLCKTDGTVPSVKGALHADGSSAGVVEDWQQGLGFLYYNDTESIPQVYRIREGEVIIDGRVFKV